MKAWIHAELSVKTWGGEPEDYITIHEFLDSSKAHFPDMRHRAIFHHTYGVYVAEQVFGRYITINRDTYPKKVMVRDIAEQHIMEDLGFIPTPDDWLSEMLYKPWMEGQDPNAKLPDSDEEQVEVKTKKRALPKERGRVVDKKETIEEEPEWLKKILDEIQKQKENQPKQWPFPTIQPLTPPKDWPPYPGTID